MLPLWSLKKSELLGSNFTPGEKEINVLVELLEAHQSISTLIDRGWTARWLQESRKSQVELVRLPFVGEQDEFISSELPVKISLHEQTYESWLTRMRIRSTELMGKIFRVANSEPCINFVFAIGHHVVEPAVHPGEIDTSFISFWDLMIRNVLDYIGVGMSDRNWTRLQRPNFLYIVDSVCVFLGEEKPHGENIETPRRQLSDMLVWSYGDAPYLLGYAAVDYEVRLYAITHGYTQLTTVQLGVYDLRDVSDDFTYCWQF